MFKSTVQPMNGKKGPFSFIKSLASPKQADRPLQFQTSKSISTAENEAAAQDPRKSFATASMVIEITIDKSFRPLRFTFSYTPETSIQQLVNFIKRELKENFIYLKAKNINMEYFLTLSQRKVKDLNTKRLQLTSIRIKIDTKNNLLANFQIIKCLGTGGFSKVFLVRGFGTLMAMKVINKGFIIQNQKENIVESQRKILEKCNGHPFITKLFMSFETPNCLIFCMQYCHGGELFNLLRKVKRMKQSQAKFYFLQTLIAISHLHSKKILYRDLKPENIIIDSQGHIRLADYGLSKEMKDDMTYSFCGSAEYMAPQMLLKKGHGFQIDYYCLGALLYELLFGLPPYYSRDQNELFSNILNNELQFPPHVEISSDLKHMLTRLLQKDTDLRFKNAAEIFASPWLSDCKIDEALAKRLDPPFKTAMFQSNFDDSDFAQEEKFEILLLEKEKDGGKLPEQETFFPDFSFIDEQLIKLEVELQKNQEKKLDFTKKPTALVQQINSPKELLWRNGSMKSIDNSQIFLEQGGHHSPRGMQTLNRSNDRFKMVTSQTSQISGNPSFISFPKTSQIMNNSKSSENFNCSGSKLTNIRQIPQVDKSHLSHYRSNQRFGSPININNYINIYTCKSPPAHQISLTTNNYISPQPKKTFSYGNVSYDKSINNSSYKSTSNIYSLNSGAERAKFGSSEKPVISVLSSQSQSSGNLKSSLYTQSATQINRGYLSNFKERFNPNQKIKKSYKTSEKTSFNFFSANTPYNKQN